MFIVYKNKSTRIDIAGRGRIYVHINRNPESNKIVRIEISASKDKQNWQMWCAAIMGLINIALLYNVPIDQLADELIGIGSTENWITEGISYESIPDAIGKVLQEEQAYLASLRKTPVLPAQGESSEREP